MVMMMRTMHVIAASHSTSLASSLAADGAHDMAMHVQHEAPNSGAQW